MSSPHARSQSKHRTFACGACQKVYSKAEHLQRHERTHTGSRPFPCTVCGRAFARADSLARHVRIHGKTQSNQQVATPASTGDPAGIRTGSDFRSPIDQPARLEGHNSPPAPSNDYTFAPPLTELDGGLEWPDAERLLEMIVSSDWSSLTLPPEIVSSPKPDEHAGAALPASSRIHESNDHHIPADTSRMAIQSLSNMITSESCRVTSAVEALPGLTPVFLDSCLQSFFSRFNPSFPVLHRPTFVFRECSPSLLLNAIALGSLFMGTEDAMLKGEVLWRLAHTAVATCWQSLMGHRGTHDAQNGVQLALTALLGQVYAMLSRNESLRITSQVYHSLGFNWARHCGMFRHESISPLDLSGVRNDGEMVRLWKTWVSRELQLRVLLGHYILDGQLSFVSQQPTSVTHTTNPLVLSSSHRLFDSPSAEEWLEEMTITSHEPTYFRQLYGALFDPVNFSPNITRGLGSSIDLRVVLECIHSLVREARDTHYVHIIQKGPTISEIKTVLFRIHRYLNRDWSQSPTERLDLLLRWHLVCLDSVSETMGMCNSLFQHFRVEQNVFRLDTTPVAWSQVSEWVKNSSNAKRALLHATAIQDIAGQLPLSHMHSMWMPMPIFAAAVTYGLFCLIGLTTVTVPGTVDWGVVLNIQDPGSGDDDGRKKMHAFFTSAFRLTNSALGESRNLRYEFNSLQTIMHGLAIQWGACSDLEGIMKTLKSHFS